MQTYFGWAKPCSCSHCCSRHLWSHDSLRLGRVEVIVTLRVVRGRKKERAVFSSLSPPPSRSLWLAPFPPLFGKFQQGAFASKNTCAPEENACTAGYIHTRHRRVAVRKFLPAQFPWNWCKCLLRNFVHSKIFNLTKYREVLVKYFTAHYACRNADLNLTLC